jgi:hypothetical protein
MEERMSKHIWNRILISGLVLLLLPISAVACSSQSQVTEEGKAASSGTGTPPIVKPYADFEVGPLTVVRSGVSVGEVATVSTTVTNTGDVAGIYKAVLTVDGKQVDQKDVSVGPKGTERFTFQVSKEAAGSYKLAIGDSTAMLNVYEWPYTIMYDSGVPYGELLSVAGDFGHIVRFTPPAVPFRIQEIDVYAQARARDESDWYNRFVTVRILDSGNNQLWSKDLPWRFFWSETGSFWKEIEVPNVSVNGDFKVEIVTHSDQFGEEIVAWPWSTEVRPAIFLGYDRPKPSPYITTAVVPVGTRSGVCDNMGNLIELPEKYQGLDWLIHVDGDGRL